MDDRRKRFAMSLNSPPKRLKDDESGAILILFAIVLIAFMGFAALAVDLGAAWSQRTLNQSAADAGVMSGAVIFLDDPVVANPGIVAEIEQFVDDNLGYQISATGFLGGGEWATCVDPEVVSGNFVPLKRVDSGGLITINPCVSLSAGASEAGEKTLRVYLPDQVVETSFASVIGIDQIATSGFAEAEMKFLLTGGALPFVVPAGLGGGDEYCIGEMPPGLAGNVCDGSSQGKRNDIISVWHGTIDPGTPACTNDTVSPDLLSWNIALGVDHILRVAGADNSGDWLTVDGQDDCAIRDSGTWPYAVKLGGGGEDDALIKGFAGEPGFGTLANAPGRLRQGTGDVRLIDGNNQDPSNMNLDNVGLWEYLFKDGIPSSNPCDGDNSEFAADGETATAALETCLASAGTNQIFNETIVDSPRLTVMPQLWKNQTELASISPNTFVNIKSFIPGFIQKTFWNCNSSDEGKNTGDPLADPIACALTFQTYEDYVTEGPGGPGGTNDIVNDRQWFAPGEGDEEACLVASENGNPRCKNNPNIALRGVSTILLDPDWLPLGAVPTGEFETSPFAISLSR